jgi:hypothetical protein
MGLYDDVFCDVKLPGRDTVADTSFQTKSLPWPGTFTRYRITAAGRFVNRNGRDLEPTGYVDFYGDDADSANGLVEYRARFVDGTLQSVVRIGDPDDRIYGLESIRWFELQP